MAGTNPIPSDFHVKHPHQIFRPPTLAISAKIRYDALVVSFNPGVAPMIRKAAVKKDFIFVLVALGLLTVILTLRAQWNKPETISKVDLPVAHPVRRCTRAREGSGKTGGGQKGSEGNQNRLRPQVRGPEGRHWRQSGSRLSGHRQVRGWFNDGKEFDRGEYPLTIGRGEVIRGWEEGLQGMKLGGKRKLMVPYQLAYGEAGRGRIPPKTDLNFEVELVSLRK